MPMSMSRPATASSRPSTAAQQLAQSAPLGSAPALLLCLFRARPAALGSSALPGREAGPLGAQPVPRLLEPAASKAADCTASDRAGPAAGIRAEGRRLGGAAWLARPHLTLAARLSTRIGGLALRAVRRRAALGLG